MRVPQKARSLTANSIECHSMLHWDRCGLGVVPQGEPAKRLGFVCNPLNHNVLRQLIHGSSQEKTVTFAFGKTPQSQCD